MDQGGRPITHPACLPRFPAATSSQARLHEFNAASHGARDATSTSCFRSDPVLATKRRSRPKTLRASICGAASGARSVAVEVDPTKLDRPRRPAARNQLLHKSRPGMATVRGGGHRRGRLRDGAVIHIFDTANTRRSGPRPSIARRSGSWHGRTGHSFFYNRLQEMKPGMPPSEKELEKRGVAARVGQQGGAGTHLSLMTIGSGGG